MHFQCINLINKKNHKNMKLYITYITWKLQNFFFKVEFTVEYYIKAQKVFTSNKTLFFLRIQFQICSIW